MNRARAIGFRAAAIILGLLPFLCVEGILRLGDWGRTGRVEDPYVGFQAVHPLFVLSEDGSRYEIPPAREGYFRPDSFAAVKGSNEFRIFCLGGSTVQGNPYSIETSFTTWLELTLRAADPTRDWQVVNCGGISYASYRLVPILQETLEYEPDLYIVYSGHNEFLEEISFANVKQQANSWPGRAAGFVRHSHTYGLLRALFERTSQRDTNRWQPGTILPAEVDALLDYQRGLEAYHRDDLKRAAVVSHYELNLRRMVELARGAKVPIVFCDPVANVRDTPPFKMETDPELSDPQRERFERLWDAARNDASGDIARVTERLLEARAIDPRHAGVHFALGKIYEAEGRNQEASDELDAALNEDVCPLRMIEPLHQTLRRVAEEMNVPLVEVRQSFIDKSDHGLVGDQWMVDHVHPSVEGYQWIAQLLFEALVSQQIASRSLDWEARRHDAYAAHLASLDGAYFERGKQHLEGLRLWSQGRAKKIRPDSSP